MVHRQKIIGNYIVDFYIAEANLVIELDGAQHYDPHGQHSDRVRDAHLNSIGLTVLRYSNADVNLRFQEVCQDICNRFPISEKTPSP